MKIIVKNAEIEVKSGTSQKTGKPYSIKNQTGYVHFAHEEYPIEIKLRIRDEQAPYPPGEYTVDDRSFYVGKFKDFVAGTLALTPIRNLQAKAA